MTHCATELAGVLWKLDSLTFWVMLWTVFATVYSVAISCAYMWVVRRIEKQESLYDTGRHNA